ncbi:phosphoglycerate kinase [Patescibacteria group bacterium]|jgi:phosphoglycerate kinase|nr:phosphoglycerate kinase [Patescibacteria group bacterium]
MNIRRISEVAELSGKRVLVRAGLNVPIKDGVVTNPFRVEKATETIRFLKEQGAVVVVLAHIGRDPEETLEPVVAAFPPELGMRFLPDVTSDEAAERIAGASPGSVFLCENVRRYPGETENDPEFAKVLASRADLYVNDAFSASHRAHASIVGIAEHLPSYAGLQFAREIDELSRALDPTHPSLFILGGAKFATKFPILQATRAHYDAIFVGGALANDFLRAQGNPIGASLASEETEGIAELLADERIVIPTDVVVESAHGERHIRAPGEVREDEKILDVGPESVRALSARVRAASFVLWNGPLGYFEGGYGASTRAVAQLVADCDNTSIVGGGDTIAAIAEANLEDSFTFLSTGGGAMLDFLADGTVPGLEVVRG